MPRQGLHDGLVALSDEAVALGREVEAALGVLAAATEAGDPGAVCGELGSDARFKRLAAGIEGACMALQARQAPVAGDLRLVHAIRAVAWHSARAGTLCEHACRAVSEAGGGEPGETDLDMELRVGLAEMARAARGVFAAGVDAFEGRDAEAARAVRAADDGVDLLHLEVTLLCANAPPGAGSPGWRARAALVAHYLERVADHGVGMGARTVFLATGERV